MKFFDLQKKTVKKMSDTKALEITIALSAVLGLLSTTIPKPFQNYLLWAYCSFLLLVFSVPYLRKSFSLYFDQLNLKRKTDELLPKIDRSLSNLHGLISGNKTYCFNDAIRSEPHSSHAREQIELLCSQYRIIKSAKVLGSRSDAVINRHQFVMDSCRVVNNFIRVAKNERLEIEAKDEWHEFNNRIQVELATLRTLFLEWTEETGEPSLADHYKIDRLI